MNRASRPKPSRTVVAFRIATLVVRILVVQSLIAGAAAWPVLAAGQWLLSWLRLDSPLRLLTIGVLALPGYAVFAMLLMFTSALVGRFLRWQSPPGGEMRIADMDWPLIRWAEYMVALHVVRLLSGGLLRGSPLWTAYLRLSGARLGRRVYINSLGLSDYNLLEFGDDVVVGADAHVAGHTVEYGVVKTAPIRLGRNVTIGIGSIVDIGVEAADGCHIAALSVVPKYSKLGAGVYAGIPVRLLPPDETRGSSRASA